MNRIHIENLTVTTMIGVHDWEKVIPQKISINLHFAYDMQKACQTDKLIDAIDYSEVCAVITEYAHHNKHQLLEHLAANLLTEIKTKFPAINNICLKIAKPYAVANVQHIAIELQA